MRAALDTNILAYAEGVNGTERKREALLLLDRLPSASVVIPVQALGELFNLLVRKAARSRSEARSAILDWQDRFPPLDTSFEVLLAAADLATDHRLGIWDSVMISAAAEAKCRILLSEDLQDGFTWKGLTVVNPFANQKHELLSALLS